MRLALRMLSSLLPLSSLLGGCYLAAGLGEFGPAGEGGEGATSKGATRSGSPGSGIPSACDHVVITELRAASGDFVELFNPTKDRVSLEGWAIEGLTAAGEPQPKWTGTADHFIEPGAYFLLAIEAVADRDAILTGFAPSPRAVARLRNAAQDPVDALCVCAMPGCTHPLFALECERALVVPEFAMTSPLSAQRAGTCTDSDDTEADFVAACPTPRADLAAAASACP